MPIQRAKPRIIDLDQTPLTSISSADMPAGTVIAAEYARKQDHQTFSSN